MLSVKAAEFVPQSFQVYSEINRTQALEPVLEIRKAVAALMDRPADFFEVIVPLVGDFEKSIKHRIALKAVVEELFEKSTSEARFQYSGARMCSYLSEHLKLDCGSFQDELIKRCIQEHDLIMTGRGYRDLSHLMAFTLLMGELLVGSLVAVEEIRSVFPSQLEELLVALTSHRSDEALLCVIQSLKLTGAVLDELEPRIGEVYMDIAGFIGDMNIPERIQMQLVGLLDLRKRGWERAGAVVPADDTGHRISATASGSDETLVPPLSTVYYDANGQEYFVDELESFDAMRIIEDEGEEEEEEELDGEMDRKSVYMINDEVMDSETAKAYETFISQLPSVDDDLTWQRSYVENNRVLPPGGHQQPFSSESNKSAALRRHFFPDAINVSDVYLDPSSSSAYSSCQGFVAVAPSSEHYPPVPSSSVAAAAASQAAFLTKASAVEVAPYGSMEDASVSSALPNGYPIHRPLYPLVTPALFHPHYQQQQQLLMAQQVYGEYCEPSLICPPPPAAAAVPNAARTVAPQLAPTSAVSWSADFPPLPAGNRNSFLPYFPPHHPL